MPGWVAARPRGPAVRLAYFPAGYCGGKGSPTAQQRASAAPTEESRRPGMAAPTAHGFD